MEKHFFLLGTGDTTTLHALTPAPAFEGKVSTHHLHSTTARPADPKLIHMILRCRQIPKFSCRTIAETAAVAIFPPTQAFLAHFARFVPILFAVKQI